MWRGEEGSREGERDKRWRERCRGDGGREGEREKSRRV